MYLTLHWCKRFPKFFLSMLRLKKKRFHTHLLTKQLTLLPHLSADNEGQIPPSAESRDIFGILGIINLLAGMCMSVSMYIASVFIYRQLLTECWLTLPTMNINIIMKFIYLNCR